MGSGLRAGASDRGRLPGLGAGTGPETGMDFGLAMDSGKHCRTTGDLAGQAPDLERLLAGRTRDISLRGRFEEAFIDRTWRQTAKIVRAWMLWVILLDIVGLIFNLSLLPREAARAMIWPSAMLAPAALAVAHVWSRRRGNLVHHLSLTLGVVWILLCVALMGVAGGGELYERNLNVMVFVAISGVVIFNIPLRFTIAIAVSAMAMYLVFQLNNPGVEVRSGLSAFLFFASGTGAMVIARETMTILAQKSFLLELRDRKRVADLAAANEQLERLSRTDPLTGVANRRSMMEAIDAQWNAGGGIALLMCDVDDFKAINDRLGHARGDETLRSVAAVIERRLAGCDGLVARYGGEEFLVLLREADAGRAGLVAEAIRAEVEAAALPNPGARAGCVVTISIGVAARGAGDGAARAPGELQAMADEALYRAKHGGRNRVAIHGGPSAGQGPTRKVALGG